MPFDHEAERRRNEQEKEARRREKERIAETERIWQKQQMEDDQRRRTAEEKERDKRYRKNWEKITSGQNQENSYTSSNNDNKSVSEHDYKIYSILAIIGGIILWIILITIKPRSIDLYMILMLLSLPVFEVMLLRKYYKETFQEKKRFGETYDLLFGLLILLIAFVCCYVICKIVQGVRGY